MCVISRPDHSQLCCWQKGWVTSGQWTHTPTNSLRMCVFVRHGSWFQCFWVSYLFSVYEKKWFCPGYTNPVLDSWGAGAHVSPGVSPLTLTCFNSSVQCLLLVPQTKRQTGLLCVYVINSCTCCTTVFIFHAAVLQYCEAMTIKSTNVIMKLRNYRTFHVLLFYTRIHLIYCTTQP